MAIRLRAAIGKDRIESAAALYSTVQYMATVFIDHTPLSALFLQGEIKWGPEYWIVFEVRIS